MSEILDDAFDERIRRSVPDSVPAEVEGRLRARLDDFRSRPVASRAARWARSARWGFGVASAAAVAVLAVGVLLTFGPRAGFAQVRDAVLERPWIHVRTSYGGQADDEQWISPGKGIWASRRRDAIEYHDERLQVYDTYAPEEKVIYRGPAYGRSRGGEVESTVKALTVLLQGDHVPDPSLTRLGLLGAEGARMKVLDQAVERVRDPSGTWLDYRLTVKHPESAEPLRMLFRVDAATKLPATGRIEARQDGRPVAREMRFDYPEKGPADIYALGVPMTAKLIDRIPKGDLKRILDTLQAGRERMDNYRAIFVMTLDGLDYMWWTERPVIFYRKGLRYRADYPSSSRGDLAATKRPGEGEDLHRWWSERTKCFRYFPMYVVRDSAMFTSELKYVTDPDGSQHTEIAVQRVNYGLRPEEMVPAEYSMRPEFACRPAMGIGSPHLVPVLNMHPTEGPPGCVLLTVRQILNKNPINAKGIGSPDGYRYWLDPQRDYIVVRSMTVRRDGAGQEVVVEDDIVEETARSPQGVWYATRVRRKDTVRAPNAKPSDQIYHIYVDFDVDLPASLFEPQKPGRVN
jgi:hypothetical protein